MHSRVKFLLFIWVFTLVSPVHARRSFAPENTDSAKPTTVKMPAGFQEELTRRLEQPLDATSPFERLVEQELQRLTQEGRDPKIKSLKGQPVGKTILEKLGLTAEDTPSASQILKLLEDGRKDETKALGPGDLTQLMALLRYEQEARKEKREDEPLNQDRLADMAEKEVSGIVRDVGDADVTTTPEISDKLVKAYKEKFPEKAASVTGSLSAAQMKELLEKDAAGARFPIPLTLPEWVELAGFTRLNGLRTRGDNFAYDRIADLASDVNASMGSPMSAPDFSNFLFGATNGQQGTPPAGSPAASAPRQAVAPPASFPKRAGGGGRQQGNGEATGPGKPGCAGPGNFAVSPGGEATGEGNVFESNGNLPTQEEQFTQEELAALQVGRSMPNFSSRMIINSGGVEGYCNGTFLFDAANGGVCQGKGPNVKRRVVYATADHCAKSNLSQRSLFIEKIGDVPSLDRKVRRTDSTGDDAALITMDISCGVPAVQTMEICGAAEVGDKAVVIANMSNISEGSVTRRKLYGRLRADSSPFFYSINVMNRHNDGEGIFPGDSGSPVALLRPDAMGVPNPLDRCWAGPVAAKFTNRVFSDAVGLVSSAQTLPEIASALEEEKTVILPKALAHSRGPEGSQPARAEATQLVDGVPH